MKTENEIMYYLKDVYDELPLKGLYNDLGAAKKAAAEAATKFGQIILVFDWDGQVQISCTGFPSET